MSGINEAQYRAIYRAILGLQNLSRELLRAGQKSSVTVYECSKDEAFGLLGLANWAEKALNEVPLDGSWSARDKKREGSAA